MLTCNKNFVDLTVWILRSRTCIKQNIMLHQSLKTESQETERRIGPRTNQPQRRTTRPDRTEPDRTGLNRIRLDLTGLN